MGQIVRPIFGNNGGGGGEQDPLSNLIISTTPPTTREDGEALIDGDRWLKPTDNGLPGSAGSWVRKGILWVSADDRGPRGQERGTTANKSITILPHGINIGRHGAGYLLEGINFWYIAESGSFDASNYWSIRVSIRGTGNLNNEVAGVFPAAAETVNLDGSTGVYSLPVPTSSFQTHYRELNEVWVSYDLVASASELRITGSPGIIKAGFGIIARTIHP